MRYKKFGSTGKDISVLCLGTWALGGKQFGAVTQEDAVAAVHAMIDCGVNIVDTAPIYASGGSEEVLGKALQGGYRDKVFLITKFGSEFVDPNDSDKGTIKDSSRKNMPKSIDASLKRLQTDYIDGYLMHWDDRVGTPIEETIACMKELKNAGKVRFLGMSNLERDLADRLLAVNMLGGIVTAAIALLGLLLEESYLLDISLIYGLISFLGVVILSQIYIGACRARNEKRKKREEGALDDGS